jgi:exonuclease SbcD
MTRLAVLADPHCDDFGSKIDAATGLNARWVDTVAMVRWVANDARERGCDALIVAGDLTEFRHPAPWRVAQIGEALDAFGGPTVLARGNHDGERNDRSIVDVLARGRPGWHGFTHQGIVVVGDVAVAVLPYADRHWLRARPGMEKLPESKILEELAKQFLFEARRLYVQASDVLPHQVLVVHQGLSGGLMSDSQAAFLGDKSLVIDSGALGAIGFDAIVAGHYHKHQVISEHPLIAYAGSPYRTDFGEANQRKGYMVVDVGNATTMQFVETPARRFVTVDYALEAAGFPDVEDAVVRAINVDPGVSGDDIHKAMELAGAWDVVSITRLRPDAPEIAGGLSESLGPLEALSAYFAADPDAEPLVALGRELLEAAA